MPADRSASRRRRRTWYVAPDGFRELRLSLGLSAVAVGCRVPWSAIRLLRRRLGTARWHAMEPRGQAAACPRGRLVVAAALLVGVYVTPFIWHAANGR